MLPLLVILSVSVVGKGAVFFCFFKQVKSAVENGVCHNMIYREEALQNQLCMIGTADENVAQVCTVVISDGV